MIHIRYSILKRQRMLKGWSQEKVAQLAEVSPSTISKIETGERAGPNSRSLRKVADALGVPMEDLILEEEQTA